MIPSNGSQQYFALLRIETLMVLAVINLTPVFGNARTVVNGDILYTGEAWANTEVEAGFLAEAQAIRSVLIECSLAHKDIKVFEKSIAREGKGYFARVVAGLTFESCEEAKTSNEEKRRRMTNPVVVQDQAAFNDYLRTKLFAAKMQFDLHGYLTKKFHSLENRLDGIENQIEGLAQQPATATKEIIIINRTASPNHQSDTSCKQRAQRLMRSAEVAAQKNFPHGNLAQGQALEFYNQAMDEYRNCN